MSSPKHTITENKIPIFEPDFPLVFGPFSNLLSILQYEHPLSRNSRILLWKVLARIKPHKRQQDLPITSLVTCSKVYHRGIPKINRAFGQFSPTFPPSRPLPSPNPPRCKALSMFILSFWLTENALDFATLTSLGRTLEGLFKATCALEKQLLQIDGSFSQKPGNQGS